MPRKKQTHPLKKRAHLLVLPHKHNAYRPHLLRARGLAVYFILVLSLVITGLAQEKQTILGATTSIGQQQLLSGTNDQREKEHLPNLQLNAKLTAAAALKAQDMFTHQYWAHESPSGVSPWYWMDKTGYKYSYAGENLAKGYKTVDAAIAAWMNSPGHRANILNSHYKQVGFVVGNGTLLGEKTTIIVAMYGSVATNTVLSGTLLAPEAGSANWIAQLGIGLQSMNSVTLGALALLALGVIVSLLAHQYRSKLPKAWRSSWKRHHGLVKAMGMASFALLLVALYGSGQI